MAFCRSGVSLLTSAAAENNHILLQQVRSYIRNFWSRPTALPFPGHMHQYKRIQGHNVGQKIRISDERPSEIKRLRQYGYEAKMKYKTGRESIMENILKGKNKYAEFF